MITHIKNPQMQIVRLFLELGEERKLRSEEGRKEEREGGMVRYFLISFIPFYKSVNKAPEN